MKKKFLITISCILAVVSILTACNSAQNGEETLIDENTASNIVTDDDLLVNNINITEYAIVYGESANIDTVLKYFNSKLENLYEIKLEATTTAFDGYNIFIGVAGNDAAVADYYAACEEGMIGFDGKNIYLLAKDTWGLYSVIDAFFAKATSDGSRNAISISQNEEVAFTKDSLTVMSYNVLYDLSGRNLTELAASIKAQNPDVFGTQETWNEHQEAILEAMPNYDCYEGIKLKGGAEMHNMIFWNADKFKSISEGFQYLTDTPYIESKIPESNSYRGFSYVVLESLATQKQFLFVNVHITYRNAAGETNDDETRLKQVQYLNKFLKGSKYESMPIILVGDFNSVPTSKTLISVENVDRIDRAAVKAKNKGDLGGTITRAGRTLRDHYVFDHIFVTTDRIDTEYFTTIDYKNENGKYLSDHLPVIAKITIV